ncbi:MAG TPA: proline iminopeptidase-family hydrolase [Chthoniobacterales bacterium]|jgi:proline iminopeptidase|nr:proline iminopeptidase-family hydrolase [Chthoniobacterales bacterium]
MERRNFLKYAAGAVTAVSSLSIPQSSTAESVPEEPQSEDALNPGGIRVGGIRMIPVCGSKYKVWTKRLGSGPVKVLLLHGGPGFPHDYLEAMESFLPQAGIEMYYYDQLGVGNSDIPDDPSLWTLPRYLTEVEEVRRGLHLDQFVLYGHSWGGTLAMEYALNYQEHLRGLVISNMSAGIKSVLKRLDELKRTLLSKATLAQFNALEAARDYDSPAYKRIVMEELYPQMICRLTPWPEPVTRAVRLLNEKIYNQMQGKSEFEYTGNLKDWERWDRLHEIRVKTLTIGAVHDEMDPDDMVKMAKMMPNAASVICPNGSHLDMWDDQAFYFQHLLAFLKSV